MDRPRALCFGDSITQYGEVVWNEEKDHELKPLVAGWISVLRNRYGRRFDVRNRGYSGYNTKMARAIAKRVCLIGETEKDKISTHEKFIFTTVFFGANDSADPTLNPKQGLKPCEYETYLKYIVSCAKTVSHQVIVIAPPCVDRTKWKDRSNDRVKRFISAAERVAQETSSDFVNLYDIMKKASREPEIEFLRDGLHLNGSGNMLLAREVARSVDTYQRKIRARMRTGSGPGGKKCRTEQEAHSSCKSSPAPLCPFWEIIGTLDRADHISATPVDFPLWRHMSNVDPAMSVNETDRLGYLCTNRTKKKEISIPRIDDARAVFNKK
eukprot:g708.t1